MHPYCEHLGDAAAAAVFALRENTRCGLLIRVGCTYSVSQKP